MSLCVNPNLAYMYFVPFNTFFFIKGCLETKEGHSCVFYLSMCNFRCLTSRD